MKGPGLFLCIVFLLLSIILILRPVIIFSSNTIQTALQTKNKKVYGIVKTVKKRREELHLHQLINDEVPDYSLDALLLSFIILLIKKWLRRLLYTLSFFFSNFLFFLKRRRTIFELTPNNSHYLTLSVFRI